MNLKKPSPLIIVIIFVLVTVVCLFFIKNQNQISSKINFVKIAGQDIKVDLALTSQSQEQGLSGRAYLKENEGMLFGFEKPAVYYFWMKDMNFPIDMIWIGDDSRVMYIKKDARPDSYPEAFGPKQNAKYVLEVVSGFSEKNNLKEGDSVTFLEK